MRYFDFVDNSDGKEVKKECRLLAFDPDILGSNRSKLNDYSIFIPKLDKNISQKQLDDLFRKAGGDIKSLKISKNVDYSSKGYGFITFTSPEIATKVLNAKLGKIEIKDNEPGFKNDEEQPIVPYKPRDIRDYRRSFNNIYVKNLPADIDDDEAGNKKVQELFGQFGNIKSLKIMKNDKGPFAFICYEHPDDALNKQYGADAALKACETMHDKEIDGVKLYVKEALKSQDREFEKKKEMLRYKNSKKRCNLYVKNFPFDTTEENLMELFKAHGELEKVKVF